MDIFEKGEKIMSKRNIDARQANGEYVDVSEIFEESAEIGDMLEKSMGKERFEAAMKALEEDEN
jgi:hypothetical protein